MRVESQTKSDIKVQGVHRRRIETNRLKEGRTHF